MTTKAVICRFLCALAAMFAALCCTVCLLAQTLQDGVVDKISAATAFVVVEGTNLDDRPFRWTGSGFFIDREGTLVTNAHVAPGCDGLAANTVEVVLDSATERERRVPAVVLATHPTSDLALLKCQLNDVDYLTIGDSQTIKKTTTCFSVGFPYGFRIQTESGNPGVSITEVSISALRCDDKSGLLTALQFRPGMQPGQSGGPLVNEHGEVVGVCSWLIGTFGNAIPTAHVHELLGEAFLDVETDPTVASVVGSKGIHVKVQSRNKLRKLRAVWISAPDQNARPVKLRRRQQAFCGEIRLKAVENTESLQLPDVAQQN